MADGRSRAAWSHTSNVLALLANCHRDPKRSRPFRADQFNPHARPQPRRRRPSVEGLTRAVLRVAKNRRGRG